jgi:hypothetical protein
MRRVCLEPEIPRFRPYIRNPGARSQEASSCIFSKGLGSLRPLLPFGKVRYLMSSRRGMNGIINRSRSVIRLSRGGSRRISLAEEAEETLEARHPGEVDGPGATITPSPPPSLLPSDGKLSHYPSAIAHASGRSANYACRQIETSILEASDSHRPFLS